jgi:hypothetical protein
MLFDHYEPVPRNVADEVVRQSTPDPGNNLNRQTLTEGDGEYGQGKV